MKKILMLTHEFPPFHGGIGTYAAQLAVAAQSLGHDITVFAPDYGQRLTESDRKNYTFSVVRYHSREYSYRMLPALLWRSLRRVRAGRYDIVHAVDAAHTLSLAFLNRFQNLPFAATVYGSEILSMPSSKQAKWLGVTDLFETPKELFAISDFTKRLLLQRCPTISEEIIRVTPLGVAADWFQRSTQPCRTIESLPAGSRGSIILTVSRMDERKGHRTVLKAIAKLVPDLQERISYVIVGKRSNSSLMRELNDLAKRCLAHVHFTGEISDRELRALYRVASVFCMPGEPHASKVEGFGLAYLEAAASHVPSIGSRIGGIPEAVLHDKTGILVEPGDSVSLSEALNSLLTNEPRRKKLGEAAYAHARTFTWQRCAEMTYG